MAKGLLGEKLGMAHIFNDEGKMVTVTILRVGPCFVSQVKTQGVDGYDSVQLAFDDAKATNDAIVHKQPVLITKGMTIGLLHIATTR